MGLIDGNEQEEKIYIQLLNLTRNSCEICNYRSLAGIEPAEKFPRRSRGKLFNILFCFLKGSCLGWNIMQRSNPSLHLHWMHGKHGVSKNTTEKFAAVHQR